MARCELCGSASDVSESRFISSAWARVLGEDFGDIDSAENRFGECRLCRIGREFDPPPLRVAVRILADRKAVR